MGSPLKSPSHKKHRGDSDGISDDELMITGHLEAPKTGASMASAAAAQTLSLQAIGDLLDKKLDPLSRSLDQLRLDLGLFKESVQAQFHAMGLQVDAVESQVTDSLSRITVLEKQVAAMKVSSATSSTTSPTTPSPTVVIGNIPEAATFESAKNWLTKHCKEFGLVTPLESDIYHKGVFNGMLFAKCPNISQRDQLIESIRKAASQHSPGTSGVPSQKLYAKMDQPLSTRTVETALYSMKRMLIDWGFNAGCIKYDVPCGAFSVAGREIVKVTVKDSAMQLEWCDGQWESWRDLQDSTELATIRASAQSKLDKAKAFSSNKGKGKGPE
jgi:hypothetical protein